MSGTGAEIERLDRVHQRQIVVQLGCYALSVSLLLLRFFLGAFGLERGPVTWTLLGLLVAALLALATCSALQLWSWRRISRNPDLAEALNNEMVQTLGAEAWLAGFLGAAGAVLFYAIASLGGLVADPVTIALTTILVGRGAQRMAFYIRYRSA